MTWIRLPKLMVNFTRRTFAEVTYSPFSIEMFDFDSERGKKLLEEMNLMRILQWFSQEWDISDRGSKTPAPKLGLLPKLESGDGSPVPTHGLLPSLRSASSLALTRKQDRENLSRFSRTHSPYAARLVSELKRLDEDM